MNTIRRKTVAAVLGLLPALPCAAGDVTLLTPDCEEALALSALPLASFGIEPHQSLDPRIPPGPCEIELLVKFQRGAVKRATLGAAITGASVIVQRGDDVLASGFMPKPA